MRFLYPGTSNSGGSNFGFRIVANGESAIRQSGEMVIEFLQSWARSIAVTRMSAIRIPAYRIFAEQQSVLRRFESRI